MAKPIKIPAGATHDEPSWRDELRRIEEKWKAGGGAKGYWQRAFHDFVSWRGPSGKAPSFIDGLYSMHADRTSLADKHLGAGQWMLQECATGQELYIRIPDLNKISEKSPLRKSFVIQTGSSYRYLHAPATVAAVLRRGYPKSA